MITIGLGASVHPITTMQKRLGGPTADAPFKEKEDVCSYYRTTD